MASSPVSSKSRDVIEVRESPDLKRYFTRISKTLFYAQEEYGWELTLVGRKLVMTSLTFCVGGPAGGAVALGVPDPVAMAAVASRLVTGADSTASPLPSAIQLSQKNSLHDKKIQIEKLELGHFKRRSGLAQLRLVAGRPGAVLQVRKSATENSRKGMSARIAQKD